jgi:hypothetical protein
MTNPTSLPIQVQTLQLAQRLAQAAQQLQGASTPLRTLLGRVACHLGQPEPDTALASTEIERFLVNNKLNDTAPESALLLAAYALLDAGSMQARRPPTGQGPAGAFLSSGFGLRSPRAG